MFTPEVIRGEVIGIIALRRYGFIGIPFGDKIMVHADQDNFFKTHVIGQLQSHIGYGCALPQPPGYIARKFRTGIRGKEKIRILGGAEKSMRTPGQELGIGQGQDLFGALLNNQVVHRNEICR